MDDTDLRILREMFIDRVLRIGGGDPRLSAATIGSRVGLATSTVSQRLRVWRDDGFFGGWAAFPNPSLLGMSLYFQILETDAGTGQRVISERAAAIPGAAFLWESGPEPDCGIWYLDSTPRAALLGGQTLGAIPGIAVAVDQLPWPMPSCSVELTRLDWRIIQGVRQYPWKSPTEVARSIHITPRTMVRRFDRLVSSRALLFLPRLEFARARGTLVYVALNIREGVDGEVVARRIERTSSAVLPHLTWGGPGRVYTTDLWRDPHLNRRMDYFTTISSPADTSRILQEVEQWPEVAAAQVVFPVRLWDLPQGFDRPIQKMIDARSESGNESRDGL